MKKPILSLAFLFVALPEIAWAHTPPARIPEMVSTLLILVIMIGLTYFAGGYKILLGIKKTSSIGRILQFLVILVVILFCLTDLQMFFFLTIVIGTISLIRSANLIRWGYCSSHEEKRKIFSPIDISIFLGPFIVLVSGFILSRWMDPKIYSRSDNQPAIFIVSLIFLWGLIITIRKIQRIRKKEKPKIDTEIFTGTQPRRLYISGGTLAIVTLLLVGISINFIFRPTPFALKRYEAATKSQLHNLWLACNVYWEDKGQESICSEDIIKDLDYGFVQLPEVEIYGSGNKEKFSITASHKKVEKVFKLKSDGEIVELPSQ
jgi:hypothetical protein